MKTIFAPVFCGVLLSLGALTGSGCTHAPVADDAVPCTSTRDPAQSDAGRSSEPDKKDYSFTTEDGRTYCFSSEADRNRFIHAHDINSRN